MKKRPLISVVVNTLNEEENIARCLRSVFRLADEIVVVDMRSDDNTRKIARKFGAKVFLHEKTGYVEPARNFAIQKARGRWILILDADEKLSRSLGKRLKEIAQGKGVKADYVLVPRKNIIFGKWIQNSRWWPDYLPRFFKKGKVVWPSQIHKKPELKGDNILTLPDNENLAIIHYNYNSLDQFLLRTVKYAQVQADELMKEKNYKLSFADLILEPAREFVSRFFAGEGYKDGFHGLALAVLQAWSVALIYLKVWEKQKYRQKSLDFAKVNKSFLKVVFELDFWRCRWVLDREKSWKRPVKRIIFKLREMMLKFF